MPASLFVNAKSRRGAPAFDAARLCLDDLGVEVVESAIFRNPRRMARAIAHARDAAREIVIVGGGDGSLNVAARLLVGSSTALGVLPVGTGNAFARDLGIASDVETACRVIAANKVSNVDVGLIADRPFLNVASIGLSTMVAASLNPVSKRILGPLAYCGPVIQAALRIKPFAVRITSEGVDESLQCLQVVLGNGRYHAGPFLLTEDAHLASGRLVLYAVTGEKKSQLLRYAAKLASGRLQDMAGLKVWTLGEGRIETAPAKAIVADGERAGKTPADFKVMKGALRVIAPESLPGPQSASS